MNPIQGFALFDGVADFFHQIQSGSRILAGTRPNADFVDTGIVNRFDYAADVGNDIAGQMSELRLRSFALGMNNPIHNFQRTARI